MQRWTFAVCLTVVGTLSVNLSASEVDRLILEENQSAGVKLQPVPVVGDHIFLRRVYVDLIGRIPTEAEIREFATWPAQGRREKLVDKLLKDERFSDRWTIFYADMLRLRSQANGGAALIAYVHNAVKTGMPYDELARRLIYTNGKAGRTPEAGFILGDNADPLAMASVTSQVFLGIRMGCAQCHDHPFDVWTRRDFYDLAAYYGRTRRYESEFANVVYATEMEQSVILWPPEGEAADADRKAIPPRFPFAMEKFTAPPAYIQRLEKLRADKLAAQVVKKGPSVDDLLADTADKVVKSTTGGLLADLKTAEAKSEMNKIGALSPYKESERRKALAAAVTDPKNKYFSRSFVNRVWKNLVGRGFVEPVDDFREDNPPVHPKTLDYLAEEFVASDYDLRALVKLVVTSDAYQRGQAPAQSDELTRNEMEVNLLATPMRRMIAESMYDSIVTAGHLFEAKHSPGKNEKTIYETVRVPVGQAGSPLAQLTRGGGAGMAMAGGAMKADDGSGYALESAIELNFDALLKEAEKEEVALDQMKVMSAEEVEAQRMMMERGAGGGRMKYEEKKVAKVIDDNPVFNTSLRMQSPAPEGHFLRVFGQPNRSDLGDLRDDTASMRQALMMLNGRITHEAARVGDLEPMYKLLTGKTMDLDAAIKLAYLEIMTRRPTEAEMIEAKEILGGAASPLDGMADLRWVLLNCNEFRFLP
ncbi:MAG: DUF1553 domain-containing protein [Pirellulaceae bacterium]|nr:DUF1553 domain-containing protein [Pirellulaceae bacterium]